MTQTREAALFGLVCVVLFGLAWAVFSRLASNGGPTIVQSTGAITVAQANAQFPPGVPNSAKNIRYAAYNEWMAVLEVVRFEAPADDCIAHAERIIADFNAQNPDRTIPGLRPMNAVPEVDRSTPLSLDWFSPESIKHGLVGGESNSHTPVIWIDTDKGVFYYQYSD